MIPKNKNHIDKLTLFLKLAQSLEILVSQAVYFEGN